MTHEHDTLKAFQHLLESATQSPGSGNAVLLIDRLLGHELGQVLRRCAVPHSFDLALLCQLSDSTAEEATELYAEFSELSMIQVGDASLTVHERWRAPIWRWWLEDAQRAEFVALSERLVEWFAAPASTTGDDPTARRRMFHLLGCRRDEGLALFEEQFRTARHHRRFSECNLLLRLVHEYDPVLDAETRARLGYLEGKLASDLRNWERASRLLAASVEDPLASAEIQFKARVRLAHVLRQQDRREDAVAILEDARAQITSSSVRPWAWRLFYELGEILRDLGELEPAIATLREALTHAADSSGDADLAGIHNSIGTVQLRLREIESATTSFQTSLDQLESHGDAIRRGGVFNNLGLAQLEQLDWKGAEASFAASLQIKRASADLVGEATTLLNLTRAQAAQERFAEAAHSAGQAAQIYQRLGDTPAWARAQLTQGKFLRRAGQTLEAQAALAAIVDRANGVSDDTLVASALDELKQLQPRRSALLRNTLLLLGLLLLVGISIVLWLR